MKFNVPQLVISLALGLGLVVLALLTGVLAQAANPIRYVAPGGVDSRNTCLNSATPCATIQYAVDIAAPGDEIRIAAGTYTGLTFRDGYTSVVYITKSITLQGGFTPANWGVPNPAANLTTLNAQGRGLGVGISGAIIVTVEGLRITGGQVTFPDCGLCVAEATATLRNNTIFNNGGAGVLLVESEVSLIGNLIHHNDNYGVASVNKDRVMLVGNTIAENKKQGVFLFLPNTATLSGNLIDNNMCRNNGDDCFGGGVYIVGCGNVTLNNNVISRNRVEVEPQPDLEACGGGVALYASTAQLNNNTVISNTSNEDGGGLCLTYQSQATLANNLIVGNNAEDSGGGVFVSFSGDSLVAMEGDTIANNRAINGGGMVVGNRNQLRLNRTLWQQNEAQAVGGGIGLFGGSSAAVTNTVLADNQAEVAGSGLYLQDNASAQLRHTTLARNSGGGNGVYLNSGSTIALTNTILVSQTVGLTASAGSTATLDGVLWFGNGANTGGAGIITIANPHSGDPAFFSDGYHLTPASAALDQGEEAGVTVDIDGQSRPFNGLPDLGADEGQPALLVSKQVDPALALPAYPLTYTLRVTNTGYVDLHATITDTLPPEVTPTGIRTWTATIPANGGVWVEQIGVMVAPDATGSLVNEVQVTSEEGANGEYTQSTVVGRVYYLPVVWKGQ